MLFLKAATKSARHNPLVENIHKLALFLLPQVVVFAGCDEFTCVDYATCPLESDASVESNSTGGASEPDTNSGNRSSETTIATSGDSTLGFVTTMPTAEPTNTGTSSNGGVRSEGDAGNTSVDLAVSPESESLGLGEPCSVNEQCSSWTCAQGWSAAATSAVCCERACIGQQRCGAQGQCQDCEPGSMEYCWATNSGAPLEGSPSALMGDCHEGERTCGSDGVWSQCIGAVGPASADTCERPGADEDCDGTPNEGCSCVDDQSRSCGTDTGNCVAGTQTCNDGIWSQCEGEVTAAAQDSCAIVDDDANCDGTTNGGCGCTGDDTRACGDCGSQSCNPDARDWFECLRVEPQARCRAGSTAILETCNAQGEWETSTCEFVCEDGECAGECAPGNSRCVTNPERRQTCSAGAWDTVETCPTGSQCVSGGAECRKSIGGSCTSDNQCVSGQCVDGVCCNTDCASVSCTDFNSQCLTHPATVSEDLCGSNGQCRSAEEVCADAASPVQEGVSCTFPNLPGGECDGAGNCVAPTVVCGNQTCSLDTEVCCERNFKTDQRYLECASESDCYSNEQPDVSGPDRLMRCDENEDCASGEVCGHLYSAPTNKVDCVDEDSCPFTFQASAICHPLCDSPAAARSACPEDYTCEESEAATWSDWWFCEPEE